MKLPGCNKICPLYNITTGVKKYCNFAKILTRKEVPHLVELKEGKWSSRSLAEWFGVSYNTYKNDISKYLEQLEFYCDFEKIYGGVTITEVYVSVYNKNLNMTDRALYVEEI
jgi:hypothetical protein